MCREKIYEDIVVNALNGVCMMVALCTWILFKYVDTSCIQVIPRMKIVSRDGKEYPLITIFHFFLVEYSVK